MARCDDQCFLQELCVAVWNTGYTLLQPHLRKHIIRSLQLAANALENIGSPLQKLRAQIHFELSKAEEANDFINKALDEGKKALYSDYGEVNTSGEKGEDPRLVVPPDLDRFRTLDKYLKPFVSLLDLRADVYSQPEGMEDKVLLLIQQAKESSSKRFQIDMLSQAIVKMKFTVDAEERGISPSDSSTDFSTTQKSSNVEETSIEDIHSAVSLPREGVKFDEFSNLIQKRIAIMSTIARLAHVHRHYQIVQASATFVMKYTWDPTDKDIRDFLFTQTDMCYLLADSLVERLSGLWISAEQEEIWEREIDEGGSDLDPRALGVRHNFATEEMNSVKALLANCLLVGIKLALLVQDEYGYQNGAIYFWNLHIHVFRRGLYNDLLPEAFEMLELVSASMETFKNNLGGYLIDEKLRACYIEASALACQQNGDSAKANDILNKATTSGTPYIRSRLSNSSFPNFPKFSLFLIYLFFIIFAKEEVV